MADNNPRDIQRPEGAPAQAETKAEIEREPSNDHLEYTKFADVDINDKALTAEAKAATDTEHQLGVWQGIKTYKRAVFWSVSKLAPAKSLATYHETRMRQRAK